MQPLDSFKRRSILSAFFLVHRRLAGKALMYVGGDRIAFRFWEGRPPCHPLPMCERPAELSALRASRIYCYVIFKVSADDTEVVPPEQISPVNDDQSFLMRCIERAANGSLLIPSFNQLNNCLGRSSLLEIERCRVNAIA